MNHYHLDSGILILLTLTSEARNIEHTSNVYENKAVTSTIPITLSEPHGDRQRPY